MRPAEVFVRPLLHDEAVRPKRLSERAKDQCTRQRGAVLLASHVRMTAPQAAEMYGDQRDRRLVIAQTRHRIAA